MKKVQDPKRTPKKAVRQAIDEWRLEAHIVAVEKQLEERTRQLCITERRVRELEYENTFLMAFYPGAQSIVEVDGVLFEAEVLGGILEDGEPVRYLKSRYTGQRVTEEVFVLHARNCLYGEGAEAFASPEAENAAWHMTRTVLAELLEER